MPLTVPRLALPQFRDLVREALARVPSHTPEWTNLNDSDPGVTLVQLFSFVAEAVGYRADLIPERNRLKFLQLLGVPLRPAAAARGLVAFRNDRGPLAATTLAGELEVLAGRVPFRTRNALTVLPVEGRLYTKAHLDATRRDAAAALYRRLYRDLEAGGQSLDFYETRAFEPPTSGVTLPAVDLGNDTVDGALWLALLARTPGERDLVRPVLANRILTLAVLPDLDVTSRELLPAGSPDRLGGAGLEFHLPRPIPGGARYDRLEARASADLTTLPGTVELRLPDAAGLTWIEDLDPLEPGVGELPPSLADTDDGARLVTWIRIRPAAARAVSLSGVWANGAEVLQRAWVAAETLPTGTGEPDQRAVVTKRPVLADTLRLAVNGELWQMVDDLAVAGPDAAPAAVAGSSAPAPAAGTPAPASKVYTLDPEAGEIRFGPPGARPPQGAVLVASYAYGGGRQGVVGIGAIDKAPALPAGLKVTNPAVTWGGDEPESMTDAEYRIPRWLRHRDRLVAADDFHDVTWEAPGVDLGRVEVLPLVHPGMPGVPADGVVTLLLIPLFDAEHPDNPEPDQLFLDAVCRHLEPRRLVTTELHLVGPQYLDLWVSVGVEVVPGLEQGPVLDRVEVEVRRFLSPLAGGFAGRGWPLAKAVEAGELTAVATRASGVASVTGLLLANADGGQVTTLPISGFQLPRLAGIAVTAGDPVPIADLMGTPQPPGTPRRLPVPVVPEEC
jgi:hypothetical protein